ncbi:MAG: hypothetical protein A2900_00550 [Candidatus Chisholmbacteria bacterium RIFCSPLOWO2_01_FULL_50_28]|uniref:Uncharacterized protein n=1 Tax=Candidatus Chisholmbacteria bacterium RIFCSPHIGHO2_01_FULL_52_32 TaxID=1797591 RepID=A0A1G1VR36_9BACT|nr:MAG: hypothetical protein A2786_00895 [Candidatus Chisholmbacteria bacterium RIFCSPHIGHO2_01_FULL_52_32]OGY19589.1 MAG: hypothetical protein A2900_00550 [Candidatus Chisholmbacteria bacterium RIFCSPLOWO2_01_FULL_50_28]
MSKQYKNKKYLKQKYEELGSTRKVGKFFGVSNGTICYWMSKYRIPRIPRLDLQDNNSGKGRRGEIYIVDHPYFRGKIIDLGLIDDKSKRDLIWDSNSIDVKTSHYRRPIFRTKVKRHRCIFYICLYYDYKVSEFVPVEVWITPARIASHENIAPGFKKKSKFDKYRLSNLRGKAFSTDEEKKYNQEFEKRYQKLIDKKKAQRTRKSKEVSQ